MRTLLSQFCEEFEAVVRPLLEPLSAAARSLAEAGDSLSASAILPELRDAAHQLEVVADKVGEQQAYVLIFGPLKSGKSTLMNAMCSAYVSEVTSLPAYPCMVYVSHSDKRELVVTRYDGQREVFSDLLELRLMLARAHTDLAAQIRATEARGEVFDAQIHFPQAIRRIDVRVPAGDLAESGAVLVDTPGLYTRMKFGYDRMTREFRDTAACAIFVVKSENLFLEQVFEEFHQLLDLFSRIFLVVNLDTGKMDLRSDGTLVPSLESEDPVRIIEAFENLAMSAPLKEATEQGRLRIYPVDLLRAASRRIRGESRTAEPGRGEPTEAAPATTEPDAEVALDAIADGVATDAPLGTIADDVTRPDGPEGPHEAPAPREETDAFCGQADFDAFVGDLTDYLNSTDYLVAFLADSLRHARRLLADVEELKEAEGVRELGREIERLTTDLNRAEHHGRTLARLRDYAWADVIDALRSEVSASTRKATREIRDRFAGDVSGAIDAWFSTDASLESLLAEELGPTFEQFRLELRRALRSDLESRAFQGAAGLKPSARTLEDLDAAGIDLDAIGREAVPTADVRGGALAAPEIEAARVPVKKGFWDWVLFRTQAAVRRRLLGPPHRPSRRLPAVQKARRLGDPARDAITLAVVEQLDLLYPELVSQAIDELFGAFAEGVTGHLEREVGARVETNALERTTIEARLERVGAVRARLDEVQGEVGDAIAAMDELTERYGEAEPAALVEPVAEPAGDDGSDDEAPGFVALTGDEESADPAQAGEETLTPFRAALEPEPEALPELPAETEAEPGEPRREPTETEAGR